MGKSNNFFSDVFDVVRLIPSGRWTSYGAIANYLGTKGSARMVGWAMNSAHGLSDVPAHRVLNKNGQLTGKHHFPAPEAMQNALEAEGMKIENDQVVDAEKSFWDPFRELV